MKIAAAYIRVSTEEQVELSPESQLDKIKAYAEAHDMEMREEYIYVDEGISGKSVEHREGFAAMITAAKEKPRPFDAILLWKFSRFARSRQDSVVYKSMLRKELGIEVISVSEQIGDDKLSIITESIIEAMDEYYSLNLAEEVKRGLVKKVERGEPVVAPPFGYRMREKQYQVDPAEAAIVRHVFASFLRGKSYRQIASELNAWGIRSRHGNLWQSRTVAYLLQNDTYRGKLRYRASQESGDRRTHHEMRLTDGLHAPLIDEDTWSAAQARVDNLKKVYGKYHRGTMAPFALHGLVRCSHCGATLSRSGHNSLQCHAYAKGRCAVSHSVTIARLEKAVLYVVSLALKGGKFSIESPRETHTQNEGKTILQNRIAQERAKLDRIREAYEAGVDSLAEYEARKRAISATIERLIADYEEHASTEQPPEQPLPKLDTVDKLQSADIDAKDKNVFLRACIDHIRFDRRKDELSIFFA